MNMLDAFFDIQGRYDSVPILSNFDLMSLYYQTTMEILRKYEVRISEYINPNYDLKQLNSFLALGFWGFIHENPKLGREELRNRTKQLMHDLLRSSIFRTNPDVELPVE